MTLTEFLLARIDEDEAAQNDPHADLALHTNDCAIHPQGMEDTWCDCDAPARVLAECDTKRRIVTYFWGAEGGAHYDEVCMILALPYAEHPSYDPTWQAR